MPSVTSVPAVPAPVIRVTARCSGCGACLLTCPEHALRPTGRLDEPLVAVSCTGCGECLEICPTDAIEELT